MSHVASIKVVVKDLKALKLAVKRLGLDFRENQKTYKWWGHWVKDYHESDAAYKNGIKPEDYGKCEHAIAVPGNANAYEIGVCKVQGQEGYRLVVDFFGAKGQAMAQRVGGNACEKLLQEYGVAVAELESQNLVLEGWQLERQNLANGDVQLVLTQQ